MTKGLLPDHYEVLGVAPAASQQQVKRAYLTAAKLWHPDAYLGNRDSATRRMQEITGAYAILRDPVRRALYDDQRARERAERETVEAREAAWVHEARTAAEVQDAAEREAERLREEETRTLEEHTARLIRQRWPATPASLRTAGGQDAAFDLVAEAFGPHLSSAVRSRGALGDLFQELMSEAMASAKDARRAAARARQAARAAGASLPHVDGTVRDATPSELTSASADEGATAWSAETDPAPSFVPTPLPAASGLPLRARGQHGWWIRVFVGGVLALGIAGYAAVRDRDSGSSRSARAALVATPAPLTGSIADVPSGAGDREILLSELRRLEAAMESARRRDGHWPLHPPRGLVSRPGVRLQVGLARMGWAGKATSKTTGQACRIDVTLRPNGHVQRAVSCTAAERGGRSRSRTR